MPGPFSRRNSPPAIRAPGREEKPPARLLIARLIPAALPGPQSMDTIVKAPLDYGQLDDASSPVRVRLASTVVRV